MKFLLVGVMIITSVACGPNAKKESLPEPQHTALVPDAGAGDAESDAPGLGEAECEALFAHVFEVAFISQRESLPIDERPTDEDLRKAKDALRAELFGQCLGASREAFHYECAMAAVTPQEMQSCMGAQ